jgi:serine/threonine protein kinase
MRCFGLDQFISELCHISVIMQDEYVLAFFKEVNWPTSSLLPVFVQTPMIDSTQSGDRVLSEVAMAQNSCASFSSNSASSMLRGVLFRTLSFFSSKPKSSSSPCRRCISEPLIDDLTGDFARCPSPSRSDTYSPTCLRRLSSNDFHFIKTIGKGSFGKVFLVRFKYDQQLYAMKVISKDLIKEEADYRHIMSERNILSQDISHPFLVKLKCTFQSESKLYIVMQFVNGGELFFHLQKDFKFSELRAKFYAAEIVSAFEFLHSKDIVYRDLKPENILLDADGHVVLVDFGLAKALLKTAQTKTFCGTPEYLAPEVVLNKQYGKDIDWWCLGSVLYEMLTGLPPFYAKARSSIFDKVLYEQPSFAGMNISDEARDFICKLLKKNPANRLGHGSDGAHQVKNHPFFAGIDWNKLYHKKYQPPFTPNSNIDHGLENFDPEFLRESISGSVFEEPCMLDQMCPSSQENSPILSSESEGGYSLCDSNGSYTCHSFEKIWNDPNDRQLLFLGFSYADTIEF